VSDLQNFRAWYVQVLESLYPQRTAGIAVVMISLPLLERYIRQKTGLSPSESIDLRCMPILRSVFPVLSNDATAQDFWQVYRNGFLHQATLSLQTGKGRTLPAGSLTHDIGVPVKLELDGSFVIQPVLFSKRVVEKIEADFNTFAGAGAPAPNLLHVVASAPSATGFEVPPVTLSTRS
jgi:hypothetical protein